MAEKDFRVKNGLITGSNTVTVGNSVYITANGDVGIGISNPSSAQGSKNLVVSADGNVVTKVISTTLNTGWARYELTTPKVNSYVLSGLYENNGTPYYWLNSGAGVTGGALYDMRYHIFRSATGSEYMRITDTGSVSIGNTNPAGKLGIEVANATAQWSYVTSSVGLTNLSGFYVNASNDFEMAVRVANGSLTSVIRSNSNSWLNSAGGNVGIGTVTPTYKLDVSGTARITTSLNVNDIFIANSSGVTILDRTLYSTATMFVETSNKSLSTYILSNQINSGYSNSGISNLAINYVGFDNGTAQFRDTEIYDGKQNLIGKFQGNNSTLYVAGNIYAPGFVDTNNPAYYLDPSGPSILNIVKANKIYDNTDVLYPKLIANLSTTSPTGNSAIQSTDVFSVAGAGYSNFLIVLYNFSPTVSGANTFIQWYGADSYRNSGYTTYTAAFNNAGSGSVSPTDQFQLTWNPSTAANRGWTGNIHIVNPGSSLLNKVWMLDSTGLENTGRLTRVWGGGELALTSPITGFQIYPASGNIYGSALVYGLS